MIFREVCHILGRYLFYISFTLFLPLAVAIYYEYLTDPLDYIKPRSTNAFILTLLLSFSFAFLLKWIGRKAKGELYRREAILVVVLIWFFTSIVSALPFYLSKTLTNPLDAYFEAMSGLTTTGASMIAPKAYNPSTGEEIPIYITSAQVPQSTYSYYGTVAPVRDENNLITYTGVEAVGKAILLWRSFLQWVGGMGIVVIFLTVLPALGVGGKFLYQMENSGSSKEGIAPRIKETASMLWKLYLSLTVIAILLLYWTNIEIDLFDAVCTAFSTISTGGFSIRNDNIASYHNPITESIILIFMVLGSINFALYFQVLRFKFFKIYVPDFILFVLIGVTGAVLVSSYLIGFSLQNGAPYSFLEAFRLGTFQALSMQTSTGFVIANYDLWPFPSQMFMLILMYVGGMSGSTSGGIKTSRFYVLYKIIQQRLESIYRPDSVRKFKIGNAEVEDKSALTILAFFCIAAFFTVLGTALFILDGIDPETALGLTSCFMNNTGVAFRAADPFGAFCFLPPFSKVLATIWMVLGRLEYYIILLLLLPTFWRSR